MQGFKYQFHHDLDSPKRTLEHREIIRKKYFLRKLYTKWYEVLFEEIPNYEKKKIVELGSGGGFLKELAPNIITSDFLDLPTNDLSFSALEMPFDSKSLDGIFMIDTFHHLPDIHRFLGEVDRTLQSGGKLVMIEPANSLWGRWIYQNFHHEPFLPEAGWTIPLSGPLSGANGALPWIVFQRDRKIFEEIFPNLSIKTIKYHTPFIYLVSGGVSFRQLLPNISFSFIKLVDQWSSKITSQLSMFMTIIIEKK